MRLNISPKLLKRKWKISCITSTKLEKIAKKLPIASLQQLSLMNKCPKITLLRHLPQKDQNSLWKNDLKHYSTPSPNTKTPLPKH